MYIFLFILFVLFFSLIAYFRFTWSIYILFLLLPTYLIRFHIGPLPTTLLEVMVWIIFVVWAIQLAVNREQLTESRSILKNLIQNNKVFALGIFLFLVAATISVFTSVDLRSAAGEWKAFYVEPILVFIVLVTTIKEKKHIDKIIYALVFCGLATSILAIYQHFTGWLVPDAFWANRNTFRVTAWYGFPNAVGLFLAPLFPLALYLLKQSFLDLKKINWKLDIWLWKFFIDSLLFIPCSLLALFFAKSTGALVGVVAGVFFLLLFYKKTRWYTTVVTILGIVCLINLPQLSNLKQEIFFHDRSGQIRLAIYSETWEFLKDNPILGAGLASYAEKIKPYHTTVNGEGIEIFHHPHNIFLTMWVNIGLLGLVGFGLIIIGTLKKGWEIKKLRNLEIFWVISFIIILVTGLVDSPYIKNDLSLLFWLIIGLILA